MIGSRLGLKALGMCALVLGLMAVWAGAAQAENTGGIWTYENAAKELKKFEGALAEPSIAGTLEGTSAVLDTKVLGGTLLEYRCTAVSVVGGKLLGPTGEVLGILKFTGCETFLAGALSKNCNPKSEIIETLKIKAFMLLHKLTADGVIDKVLIAEPDTGSNAFAHVISTEACSYGEDALIGGKFAFYDPVDPTTHLVRHLIKEFPKLTHLWVLSDTPEHAATITGSAEAFLTGTHENLKWAGLWN